MNHASNPSITAAKAALRREMRGKLAALDTAFRAEASLVICGLAAQHPAFRAARCVALFSPLPGEPDLAPLIEEAWAEKKQVVFPRLGREENAPRLSWHRVDGWSALIDDGPFGLREPEAERCPLVEAAEIGAIFVPGLAYDATGMRLGRGGGYYDRLLAGLASGVPRLGLMFGLQKVPQLPREPHDQALPAIITEEGLSLFNSASDEVRSIQPPPSTSSPT
jgi:5-formyltetrahydrofolate cyclo-ligase